MIGMSGIHSICTVYKIVLIFQGLEFALWFFERITRFLRAKEQNSDLLFFKE